MSVIQRIRKNGKLAGYVIGVSLTIWIISEGANSSSLRDFFRGEGTNSVAMVGGEKITPRDFQSRVKEFETLMTVYNPKNVLDDNSKAQLSEQVLQNSVVEMFVGKQCDKLGIVTTDEEKKELIYGENADPLVKRFSFNGEPIFNNPETNSFDPPRVSGFEKQLREPPKGNEQFFERIAEQWTSAKEYVLRNNRINKFTTIFLASVYQPQFAVKKSFDEKNAIASIRYVKVPFSVIGDDKIKVTDDDIKEYLSKHKGQYETEQETRTIEYVPFEIIPASADTYRVVNTLNELKSEFAAIKEKENRTFVNSKSDDPGNFSEAYVNKKSLQSQFVDSIMELREGQIFGPYFENKSYKITKVVVRKTLPDSIKVRHILVKTKEQGREVLADTIAKARIDSIVSEIKKGVSFDSMVVRFSDDGGSSRNGGVYEWSLAARAGIVKEFGDFAFEGKTGEKKTIKVESGAFSGYHYIEILSQKNEMPAVQIATISKTLLPSDSTGQAIYAKANEFAGKSQNAQEFDNTAKKFAYDKRICENIKVSSFSMQGIGNSREVIRWVYDHKKGDVSSVFQIGEQRYIVAKLISIQEKDGLAVTPINKPMLEQKVKEEKKAKQIIEMCKGKGSLDAIAAATNQQAVQLDTLNMGASFVPNLGYEPKVVGYAFYSGFQPNTLSPGIKGMGGVYYITVLNRANLPEDPQAGMKMAQQRYQEEMQLRNTMGQMLQQAIPKLTNVKYYQTNF